MGRLLTLNIKVKQLRAPKFPQDPETKGRYSRPVIQDAPKVIRRSTGGSTGGSSDSDYDYDLLQPEVIEDAAFIEDVCAFAEVTQKAINYAEINEICLHSFSGNFAYANEFDCSIVDVCGDAVYSSSDEEPLLGFEHSIKTSTVKMPFELFMSKKEKEEKRLKEEKEEEERRQAEEAENLRIEEERLKEQKKKEEEEKCLLCCEKLMQSNKELTAEAAKLNEEIQKAKTAQLLAEAKLSEVRKLSQIYDIPALNADFPEFTSLDDPKSNEVLIKEQLADKQEKASIADSGIDSPDYNEKNGHGFDLDLKKNPKYEDEDNVKPVLCCCIQ